MNKSRYVYAAPLDALAVTLIACTFLAIWSLWPASKTGNHAKARPFQETSYVFMASPVDNSRDPTQLVRPPMESGGGGHEYLNDREAVAPSRMDAAVLLERSPASRLTLTELDLEGDAREEHAQAYVDTVLLAHPPVSAAGLIRVRLSDELVAGEFDTTVLSSMPVPDHEQSWTIRADVALDEHGSVTHVLLTTAAEDAGLNAAVLRALYGSHGKRNGQPFEGTVTISATGDSLPGTTQ